MRLSMWILADWLQHYQPLIKIQSGKQEIRNVRLLSDSPTLENHNVYVGNAKDFINTGYEGVICVNGKDFILLKADSVGDVFNEVMNAFDYYNSWNDNIYEKINHGCSLQDIIDLCKEIIDCPLLIADSSHHLLAISSSELYHESPVPSLYYEVKNNGFLPIDMITQLNQELQGKQKIEEPYLFTSELFPFKSYHKNIFNDKEHVGWLMMTEQNEPLSNGTIQLFNTLGNHISLWMAHNLSQNNLTPQSELFLDILNQKEIDTNLLNTKLNYIEWAESDEKYLLKIMTTSYNDRIYNVLKNKIEQTFSGCYVMIYQSSIVLVLNTKIIHLNNLLADIKQLLHQSCTYCGISYPFFNILQLRQAYEQATIALSHGETKPGSCNYCHDYVLSYTKNILQKNINSNIKHQALYTLSNYDKKHNTEYYDTLKTYLDYERNQIKTAEIMNIHRNTLVYRINRIAELLNIDLNDINIRKHIMLSYLIDDK